MMKKTFPCVIVGKLIAEGILNNPGVNPPEMVGKNGKAVEIFINELKKRNVKIHQEIVEL